MSTFKKRVSYIPIVLLLLMQIAWAQEKNQNTQPQVTDVNIAGKSDEEDSSIQKKQLDEIVVTGYTTGTQKTISGALQKVGRAEMNTGVVNNPLNLLSGKAAGVQIQTVGGDPTVTPAIRIRGTTSLSGGNDPLVIIDGVFGDLSMLNAIPPADIESFTILKDASETAQYGSRGASGVIVVTTYKGKIGAPYVSYDGMVGVETVYKNIKTLNASEYLQTVANGGYTQALKGGSSTDFIKQMERVGFTQNHNIAFGSGNEKGYYRASFGYIGQQGIVKTSDMQNFMATFDATQKMFKDKLKIEFGIFGSQRTSRFINDYQKTFYSAAAFNPTLPAAQNADGFWPEDPNANEVDNPLGRLTIQDVEKNTYANAHARLTYTIIQDLTLSAFGSFTYNAKKNSTYIPNNIRQGIRSTNGQATQSLNESYTSMGNINLNYKKTFYNKHFVDVLALAEIQQYSYNGFNAQANSFTTNDFGYDNLKAGAIVKWGSVGSYANENRIVSFLGRANYVYDGKYIVTANIRGDGSSKLGANNKWGAFPSASVAWVMSNENFLKTVKVINNLKVRAGFGVTGNQDAISAYNSLLLYAPTSLTNVNGQSIVTFGIQRNANPDLRWETKEMWNAGVDLSVLDNRLNVTVDYYYSTTKNLLYNYQVSVPPFVYPTLLANLGSMRNQGVEIAVSGTIVKIKDFEFTAGANITWQQNKLLSLSGTYQGQSLSASQYMSLGSINGAGFIGGNNQVVYQIVGQPVGVFYLPHARGLADNGLGANIYDIQYYSETKDLSDAGGNRKIAGQAIPKLFMGINLHFKYKGFDLSTQINGAFGHYIYNGTSLTYMNMNQFPTYNVMVGAPEKNIKDQTVTDYWLEKGDYANIQYITLGYTVNTQKFNKWVKAIRVSVSVNNVYTFTSYTGLTPMINSMVIGNDLGIDDKRLYPVTRTYSLALHLQF